MSEQSQTPRRFTFPRWANYLLPLIVVMVVGGGLYVPVVVGLGFSPKTTDVGYMPQQPVPYSHQLHVGKLGMDCRYCHTTVEQTSFASIPPTQTCMNCHTGIHTSSANLAPVRESFASGKPIEWVKVHDLAEFAYFDHSAHVNRGVGCVSCHGRVDQMEVVWQHQPLSMAWCLECHREPENHLRPVDTVTQMSWTVERLPETHPQMVQEIHEWLGKDEVKQRLPQLADEASRRTDPNGVTQREMGFFLKERYQIRSNQFMQSCSTCHR